MADNMMRKKSPSFPSNYVTLAQLQERWLKEKERKKGEKEEEDRRQKLKQLEDEVSEARRVERESASPGLWYTRRSDSPEPSAPEVEPAGDGGEGDNGENTTKAKKKKNNKKKKAKSQRQRELGSTAENGVAAKEQPLLNVVKDGVGGDTRGEIRVESGGLDRTVGTESDSRVLSANRGTGKKRHGSAKGGKSKSLERRKTVGEARAASDIMDEKSRVLSVNVVIAKEDEGLLRTNGDGDGDCDIEQVSARRSWEMRRDRGEARPESSGLDRSANVESKFRALSVKKKNGGFWSGKGKIRSSETRAKLEPELMGESYGLDQLIDVESQSKALSVNGETAKRNNGQKRSGKSRRKSGETRVESDTLDRAIEIEPKLGALPVNGVAGVGNEELRKSRKKQDGSLRRNRKSEIRPKSNGSDQTVGIESEVRDLPINGGVRKGNAGSRGKFVPVIRNKENEGGRVKTKAERTNLDPKADTKPEFKTLSVNGETKEGNGTREESQEIRVKTIIEGDSLTLTNNIKSVIRTVPALGRTRKGNGSAFRRTSAGHNHGGERDCGMVWVKKDEAQVGY